MSLADIRPGWDRGRRGTFFSASLFEGLACACLSRGAPLLGCCSPGGLPGLVCSHEVSRGECF